MMEVKYQSDAPVLSDVCLFSSFNFSVKVEEYVFYYLSELKKAGFSIVFISTSKLQDLCISRLSELAFLIIERENQCPDFGSWQAGLSMLNWGKNLNAVLLVNDSVFGPFYDIGKIISSMKNKYNVWGMTDSYDIDYHLQSYFLYFNKAAITSEIFIKFWKNVDLYATKEEVIFKYEIGLSSLFSKSNLSLGAYASIDVLTKNANHNHKIINPTLVFWKSLINTYEFPFLKRELIIKMSISKTYSNVDLYINVGNWKRIIKENSDYPVSNITEFMHNYYKTIKALNSNIVLRKRKILFLSNNAAIGEAQNVLVNFLNWLKNEQDIEVEIIICNEGSYELVSTFAQFGIVTNFCALSESGKRNLKERLIDEVAIVFSNTFENLTVQKFLSFLDVPQIVVVHEPISNLKNLLPVDNNIEWVQNNISQFITSSTDIRKNIVDYFGVEDNKINFAPTIEAPKLLQLINKYYDDEELTFIEDPLITFMTHLYDEDSWEEIRIKLKNFDNGKNYFLFSISEVCLAKEQIIETIKASFKNYFFLITANIGKDIGGKLALIDLYLLLDLKSFYIVFLHDKQSPHSISNTSWKNNLFKMIDPNNQRHIFSHFKDPKIGIVGIKEYIVNEHDTTTDVISNTNQLAKELLAQLTIKIENYDFFSGSMFWSRASIIEKSFGRNHPILMRENLVAENILDLNGEKFTHTWERIFSWIASNEGYRIKGI